MKRSTWRITAFLLLALLLPTMLLYVALTLPKVYGESYYAELAPLTGRLDGTQGKKLMLIGGSNIAFGIDVALLEELLTEKGFDYTVCPYGLYAAIGTSAMLSLSQDALGEGDLVVLAIEPTDETLSDYFGASAFLKCAEGAPWLLGRLNAEQRRSAIGNAVSVLQERLAIVRSGVLPAAGGVYSRAAFGENGNLDYFRAGNTMALGFDSTETVDLAAVQIQERFRKQVNAYCAAAERKGAHVLLSFSPVNRSALTDTSEAAVYTYFTRCAEAFVCPVISDPNRYILDSAWFYDSNFHLNTAGAQLRTLVLAEDLLAQLGCAEALGRPLPTAPESAYVPAENGADSADFLFEASADGGAWLVSGLTESGLSRSSLTVPSACEGKSVIGFTADALAGASALEELRLPPSIETLPGGLFADCPSLARLILEHVDAPCGLSPGALDGANRLRVYVPKAAYPFYRDGYGCEANPWQTYLDRIYTF